MENDFPDIIQLNEPSERTNGMDWGLAVAISFPFGKDTTTFCRLSPSPSIVATILEEMTRGGPGELIKSYITNPERTRFRHNLLDRDRTQLPAHYRHGQKWRSGIIFGSSNSKTTFNTSTLHERLISLVRCPLINFASGLQTRIKVRLLSNIR